MTLSLDLLLMPSAYYCAPLTRDLFAIAEFLFIGSYYLFLYCRCVSVACVCVLAANLAIKDWNGKHFT